MEVYSDFRLDFKKLLFNIKMAGLIVPQMKSIYRLINQQLVGLS